MSSIADVIKRFNVLEPKIDRLLAILEATSNKEEQTNPEAIAAKIISDISNKIDEKDCCDKILEAIKNKDDPSNQLAKVEEQKEPPNEGPKYTFPNFLVGNANLGTTSDPQALKWPPTKK